MKIACNSFSRKRHTLQVSFPSRDALTIRTGLGQGQGGHCPCVRVRVFNELKQMVDDCRRLEGS